MEKHTEKRKALAEVRRLMALLVCFMVFISTFPLNAVFAADESNSPTLTVEGVDASPGDEVNVSVNLSNNPGILGATLVVEYDEGLTLLKGAKGEAFDTLDMMPPGKYQSPCKFLFAGTEIGADQIFDGTVLNLTFKVADDAASGSRYAVNVSYEDGSVVDNALEPIALEVKGGYVTVDDYLPGDLDGNKTVDVRDAVQIKRFVAGGYDLSINEDAADVNADWRINTLDVILLQRYIVGGYDVKLIRRNYVNTTEQHELVKVEFKAATCTEPGNVGYWYCEECNKYYSDELGVTEVAQDQIILEPLGHTEVIDPAVEPTATTPGLTEGSHCSVCGATIVAQKEWASNYYTIKYDVANGDTYLSKLDIENPNPTTIAEGASKHLEDLEVDGYRFLGWYDGAGSNATQVQKIENADHNMKLYAHWEPITYTIQFKSDLVSAEETEYNPRTGKLLPTLTLDGYTFIGWTDFDGKLVTRIKPGTTGDKVFYANWISDRNQAWAKKKLDEPITYEDDNVILFTYEIGDIRNVPLYEIKNFGKINSDGVELEVTEKYSTKIEESLMESYSHTVEDATTNTDTWTLSKDWNDSVYVSEEVCDQAGITQEEAISRGTSETGNWYVTNSKGGSSSTTVSDSTDTYDLHTENNNTRTWIDDYQEIHGHGVETKTLDTKNTTESLKGTVGMEVHYDSPEIPGWGKAGGNINVEAEGEHKETENTGTETTEIGDDVTTMKGGVKDDGDGGTSGTLKNHTVNSTNTSNWNSEWGRGGSTTTVNNKTVSKALSKMISETRQYGKTYIQAEGESNTQGISEYTSSTDENGTVVTHTNETFKEETATLRTSNTKSGYHRWVIAGTAHVFGVVGYDIATRSYFVYTFSVIDDQMYRFEDYSYDSAAFNDNQTGVIPFEIPIDIKDYVSKTVLRSDGLEFDTDGTVTAYSGDDTYVTIPDYAVIDNLIGKPTVVRVTGISSNAFRGNKNLTGIKLSKFIRTIPDNCFRDCENLWEIQSSVNEIGANAFDGCPLLNSWNITDAVTSLGNNAFENADNLRIKAANSGVVKSALLSGAKNISMGIDQVTDSLDGEELVVPDTVESIWINGYARPFNNVSIKSDAAKTYLNQINIESAGAIPLQITSPEVRFNQCNITSAGACAALTGDATTLDLYGKSTLTSSGPNALFARNLTTQKTIAGLATSLNLTGDLVTCNNVNDPGYIKFNPGEIRIVDSEAFDKLLHSYKLTFDPAGGECEETSRDVPNGTKLGALPTPTRTGFNFKGWQTSDGQEVTEDTVFSSGEDITITAKWEAKKYSVSWTEAVGSTIKVERTSSPNQKAETGELPADADIYYGDVLKVTYQAAEGFSLKSSGETDITVTGNVTGEQIYAETDPYSYTASWTQGTGYKIAVSRDSSPYGKAETGALSSGDKVYYGDVLSVTYSASTGYTLGSTGEKNITVNSNVTSSQIFASATANSYTYKIVYKSKNGTDLGSTTATYKYGTSNKINAPAKTGYATPASQTVAWDSTSAKTITFTYNPNSVSTSQFITSGNWWWYNDSTKIDYRVDAEYKDRTANSVKIRIKWTNTISANAYYGFGQYFNAYIGGAATGDYGIATRSTWGSSASYARSAPVYTAWQTVSVGPTTTSVKVGDGWLWDDNGISKGWTGKNMAIPTY